MLTRGWVMCCRLRHIKLLIAALIEWYCDLGRHIKAHFILYFVLVYLFESNEIDAKVFLKCINLIFLQNAVPIS